MSTQRMTICTIKLFYVTVQKIIFPEMDVDESLQKSTRTQEATQSERRYQGVHSWSLRRNAAGPDARKIEECNSRYAFPFATLPK